MKESGLPGVAGVESGLFVHPEALLSSSSVLKKKIHPKSQKQHVFYFSFKNDTSVFKAKPGTTF